MSEEEINMPEKQQKRYCTPEEYLALESKAEYKSEYHDGEIVPLDREEEDMPVQTEKRYCTPEEYFALEETAEYKSEYHNGEIIPMTGGTTNHNKIAGNFYRKFPLTVKGQNHDIFMGDVRLSLPRYGRYVYPDIMVIQGKPVYQGAGTTTVTNPLLIVEVLSKSTSNYDKGDKFQYYRSIPDLREYVIIDQYTYHVEQFAKTSEGKWVLSEFDSADALLSLTSVEFQIPLSEIYERVNFEESGEE
jgi:Uma2 family endonuclease